MRDLKQLFSMASIAALLATLSVHVAATESTNSKVDPDLPPRLPLNELRVFAEVFDRVSSAYVEEIDDRTLLENAIKGMLSRLDPHSDYLDRASFSELQESTTGNYGGLGLEVGMDDGFIKVIAPMDDTPADKAGIEAGDLIIELNDAPVKGMSLSEAIDDIRGDAGSDVKLTILRDGESTPKEFTITREIIKVASVRHRFLEDGYGYLRIAQFQSNTGSEVEKAVEGLLEDGRLLGLVIDLRNNPGGVLQSAVEVSDVFVDEGLIVYTTGRISNADLRFNATTPDATDGVPIVVLVNEGTASASEIVAGALQDHSRAVIMGTTTFGKGSVQTVLPLNNEKAIKLTTALYFTPNGRSIQAEGIVPDIWVDRAKVTKLKSSPWRIKEKDLAGHLANGNGDSELESESVSSETSSSDSEASDDSSSSKDSTSKTASSKSPSSKNPSSKNMELASSDYQLNEALALLKGLNILAKRSKQPHG